MIVSNSCLADCEASPRGVGEASVQLIERETSCQKYTAKPILPPLDELSYGVAMEVSERWRVPCEQMFDFLAIRMKASLR